MVLEYFPKTEDAEEQRNSQAILYLHGVHKGTQAGSMLGFAIGGMSSFFTKKPFIQQASSGAGKGLFVGALCLIPMIAGRMRGKEEIEWKDRAWRLQRNENQLLVDKFCDFGIVSGLIVGPAAGLSMLSGAGVGCLAALVGYGAYTTIKSK